jgi:hypothetical protein
MSKGLFAVAFVSALALSTPISAPALAQSQASAAEVSAAIRSSVAKRMAIPEDTVVVTINNNIIEVSVRSTRSKISASEFHNESSPIEEEVVAKIANNSEYKAVHTIRIKHVAVAANGKVTTLHAIDYRRNVHGLFEPHAT